MKMFLLTLCMVLGLSSICAAAPFTINYYGYDRPQPKPQSPYSRLWHYYNRRPGLYYNPIYDPYYNPYFLPPYCPHHHWYR